MPSKDIGRSIIHPYLVRRRAGNIVPVENHRIVAPVQHPEIHRNARRGGSRDSARRRVSGCGNDTRIGDSRPRAVPIGRSWPKTKHVSIVVLYLQPKLINRVGAQTSKSARSTVTGDCPCGNPGRLRTASLGRRLTAITVYTPIELVPKCITRRGSPCKRHGADGIPYYSETSQ